MILRTLLKIRTSHVLAVLLMGAHLFLTGCNDSGLEVNPNPPAVDAGYYDSQIATEWMDVTLSAVKVTPGFSPPVASRAYGYAGLTLYESVVHGTPNGRSMVGQLNAFSEMPTPDKSKRYHWMITANAAMAEMTRLFFPTAPDSLKQRIEALEQRNYDERLRLGTDKEVLDLSKEFGQDVARTIFKYSKSDGGHEGYSRNFPASYTVPKGLGFWEPTNPAQPIPLQPYWGKNRPFLLNPSNAILGCDPGAPPTISQDSTSQWFREGIEVYNIVKNLTPEQKQIAVYWSDDPATTSTPPGHSISIATQFIREQGKSLWFAAQVYLSVGISVSDAFIGCWEVKYKYNQLRPITFIEKYIDPNWRQNGFSLPLSTPPFPDYVSGHSVQTAASYDVMKVFFGNIGFFDKTHVNRGLGVRRFASLDQAKNECAMSRLYGGIHYRYSVDRGVTMGSDIAKMVTSRLRYTK